MNPFVEAIGILGGGIGFFISIPQLIRVVKNKSQVGVSLGTWLFILMSCVGWTTYGVRFESLAQIVTNSVAATLAIVLSFVLMRERFPISMRLLVLMGVAVPTMLIVMFAPLWLMEITLYVALWSRMPQIFASYQSLRMKRSSMVSLTTYWLGLFSSAAWVVYGILSDRLVVTIFSGIVGIQCVIIVILESRVHRAVLHDTSRTPKP